VTEPTKPGLLKRLTSHIPPGQFVRYVIVGVWNTAFGFSTYAGIYWLLHHKDVLHANMYGQVIAAQILSNFINITVAYLGYKFFVFKTKGNYLREWLKAMAVYGSGFLPSLILLPSLVKGLQYVPHMGGTRAPYIASALLMGFGVFYSFIGHKKVTFRVPPEKELEEEDKAVTQA
jgi:putative flippase GtrA